MRSVVMFATRFATPLVLGTMILAAGATWLGLHSKVAGKVDHLLPVGAPELENYAKFKKTFNDSDMFTVTLERPDLFSKDGLSALAELTKKIGEVKGVKSVSSLSTLLLPELVGEGVEFKALMPEEDPDVLAPDGVAAIKARAMASPSVVGRYIGKAGTTALIMGETKLGADPAAAEETLKKVGEVVDTARLGGADARLSGLWYLEREAERLIRKSWYTVGGISGLVALVVLLVAFSSLPLALATVLHGITVMLLTVGAMSLLGIPTSILSAAIPPFTFCLATAALTPRLRRLTNVNRAIDFKAAVISACSGGAWSLIGAGLAVAVALAAAPWPALRMTGAGVAIATLFHGVLAVTFHPALLVSLRSWLSALPDWPSLAETPPREAWLAIIQVWSRWSSAHRQLVTGISVAILILGALGASRLKFDTNPANLLGPGSSMRRDLTLVDARVSGPITAEMVAKAKPGTPNFSSAKTLRAVDSLLEALEKEFSPDVTGSASILDFYKETHRAFKGAQPTGRLPMPDSDGDITSYTELMQLGDGQLISKFMTIDNQSIRAFVSRRLVGNATAADLSAFLSQHAATHLGPDVEVALAGFAVVCARLDALSSQGLVSSFALSILALGAVIALRTRSVMRTLAGLTACLVPVSLVTVALGLAQFHIDVSLVPIGTLAVLVSGWLMLPHIESVGRPGDNGDAALDSWLRLAILIPVLASLTASPLRSISETGILTALIASVAAMAQVTIAPALSGFRQHPEATPEVVDRGATQKRSNRGSAA